MLCRCKQRRRAGMAGEVVAEAGMRKHFHLPLALAGGGANEVVRSTAVEGVCAEAWGERGACDKGWLQVPASWGAKYGTRSNKRRGWGQRSCGWLYVALRWGGKNGKL